MKVSEILNENSIKPSLERLLEKMHDLIQERKTKEAANAVVAYFYTHYKFIDDELKRRILHFVVHESDDYLLQETERVCNTIDKLYNECGVGLFKPYITIVEAGCGFYINESGKLPPSFSGAVYGVDSEDIRFIEKDEWYHFLNNTNCTEWEDFQTEYKDTAAKLEKTLADHPTAKILAWTYDADEVYCITVFEGK